jgi:hypothetical protein
MHKPRRSHTAKVLTQLTRLSSAAPQVIAHRLQRMAAAGPVVSARDRREFSGMVAEKPLALAQAWQGMWHAGAKAQQELLLSLTRTLLQPGWVKPATGTRLARQIGESGLAVLSQGLAPLERKASANARRLAKGRKR